MDPALARGERGQSAAAGVVLQARHGAESEGAAPRPVRKAVDVGNPARLGNDQLGRVRTDGPPPALKPAGISAHTRPAAQSQTTGVWGSIWRPRRPSRKSRYRPS